METIILKAIKASYKYIHPTAEKTKRNKIGENNKGFNALCMELNIFLYHLDLGNLFHNFNGIILESKS